MFKRIMLVSALVVVLALGIVGYSVFRTPAAASGTASATVLYRDFNLAIPDSPSVDTVADSVTLELEFVAQAVEG